MEGTQEGQTSYLSGDVPVECVRPMPASLTAARGPGTVSTGVQRQTVVQVETLGAQQSQEGSQPHSPSQDQIKFTCPLCLREKAYQGTAASVAAHQREVHPGEGKRLLAKLGRPPAKDTPLESIWCLLQVQRSPREPQQTLEWVRSNTLRYHTTAF